MFTIIGGDGREYGPVTIEQIRAWIAAGRANLETKVKPDGTTEWRRLGDLPEFGGGAVVPPLIGTMPAPFTPGVAAPAAAAPTVELASAGARTGAALLNMLVYFISLCVGGIVIASKMLRENPDLAGGDFAAIGKVSLANGDLMWVYGGFGAALIVQLLLIAIRGQNLGKLAVGAQVVRADNGQPAGFVRAGLLRFVLPAGLIFLPHFAWFGWLFLVVDYCFIFRDDHRCIHDLIAGTKVIKVRR